MSCYDIKNGNGYIKKKGSRELISLNPKFDNVQISEYDTVYCMGKVIGKQGRIAKAIRSVVKAASSKDNTRVDVEIV